MKHATAARGVATAAIVSLALLAAAISLTGCTALFGSATLSVPTGVSATQGDHSDKVAVSWTSVSASATYHVYRSASSGGTYSKLNGSAVSGISYEDKTVSAGTHYWYRVTAADVYGDNETSQSTAAEGWSYLLASPTITPEPQTTPYSLGSSVAVTIKTAIQSDLSYPDIRYTTDGSIPTSTHGSVASGGTARVTVNSTTTLKAIAVYGGMVSEVAAKTYTFDAAAWNTLGIKRFSSGQVKDLAVAVYNGVPYVAYTDESLANKLVVRSFQSGNWMDVGGTEGIVNADSSDTSELLDMAIDATGKIYIAYNIGSDICVAYWNGSSWNTNFGGTVTTAAAQDISVSLNGSTPYVTYQGTFNAGTRGYYYNGSSWVYMGAGDSGGYPGDSAYFGGALYVPSSNGSTTEVQVLKYAAASWSVAQTFTVDEYAPDLASDGTSLYLMYNNSGSVESQNALTVRKFDGSSWTLLGNAIKPAGTTLYSYSKARVAAYQGTPYVLAKAYSSENQLYVMYYDGSSWLGLPADVVTDSGDNPMEYKLAVDPANGSLYVAYNTYGSGISVKKYP